MPGLDDGLLISQHAVEQFQQRIAPMNEAQTRFSSERASVLPSTANYCPMGTRCVSARAGPSLLSFARFACLTRRGAGG